MIDIDNPKTYQQIDHSEMLKYLHEFPEECHRAWQKAMNFDLPRDYTGINSAVILGMGGSAIGGDFINRIASIENRIPVRVHREYDSPPFLDKSTLLIASSYSGNTEEVMTSFTESLKIPAKRIAITTGGNLKKLAEEKNIPVLEIEYESPPRAAFPHSFVSLLGIFHKLGLLEDKSVDMEEAIEVLKKLAAELVESIPFDSNPAKQLAAELQGRLAVIYGAGILSEVATRWKTQLNENSKAWAFYEVFSELNHNAIVGYIFPAHIRERTMTVLLHSGHFHHRLSLRYHLTAEILNKAGVNYRQIEARGERPVAQMMSTALFGDWVSFYLALLNRVDPTPVVPIDYLKKRMAD